MLPLLPDADAPPARRRRRRRRPARRAGVGLVELMVAVTLVSLCAVVAIPQYLHFHRKAKRAEVLPTLRAIASAQQTHYANTGEWLALPPNPAPPVGRDTRTFERDDSAWSRLAWSPETGLRCSYDARLLDDGERVRIQGLCDLDEDRQVAIIRLEVASATGPGVISDPYPERF